MENSPIVFVFFRSYAQMIAHLLIFMNPFKTSQFKVKINDEGETHADTKNTSTSQSRWKATET